MSRYKDIIFFEEDDWTIVHGTTLFYLFRKVQIKHRHGNHLVPNNRDDWNSFYNFGEKGPPPGWYEQCSKDGCGKEPPSKIKTRFRLLEYE